MSRENDFRTLVKPVWCPGCGNFGILSALRGAMADSGREPHEFVVISGIGCHGPLIHYINANRFHPTHGRTLPVSTGIRLSNHELTVLAVAGDGDSYSIGLGHLIHAMKRNLDVTHIVHNNKMFSLTTGQPSPTTDKGTATRSTPFGSIEVPVNPIALALSSGATYVSRGFAGDAQHLRKLIAGGIAHKGFSLIDVLQPCVTFDRVNTYDLYRQRVYRLEDGGHDPKDLVSAYEKAREPDGRIPTGLFYREERPTYEDEVASIRDMPLVRRPVTGVDITKTMEQFM